MLRDKLSSIRDYVVKHYKVVFPVIVVAIVAVTVTFAMKFAPSGADTETQSPDAVSPVDDASGENGDSTFHEKTLEELYSEGVPQVPLVSEEDGEDAIYSLVEGYYNALANGDVESLRAVHDTISENVLAYYKALSEYIECYSDVQVSTKQGLSEGSTVIYAYYRLRFKNHEQEVPGSNMLYVCTDDEGNLYIKNENNFTEAEEVYIDAVSHQDDVIAFKNRVEAEYLSYKEQNPEMVDYVSEVIKQANVNRGVALAEMNQSGEGQEPQQDGEGEQQDGQTDTATSPEPEPEASATPEYATATTNVNVRNSDSEKADKLGRVTAGTKVKVQEVGVNGWTKIVYEGGDGYIKSEYLQFAESASGQDVIGKVTATTNVNVRASAGEQAEKLGMVTGGESLDLLAVEGDWCKVVFDGQVGYVKGSYVQVQ